MKSIAAKLTSLLVVVLLWTAAGFAQYDPRPILKVDVPFEFSVGKKTFPAGEYEVVQIAPHTLALRDSKERFLTSIVTSPVLARNARSTPVLRFEVDGDQHVLSQVWPSFGTTGHELAIPKRVTYLAQQRNADVEVQASESGKR